MINWPFLKNFPCKDFIHIKKKISFFGEQKYKTVGDRLGSPKPSPKAEARPRGRAVSKERLGDWDGQMDVWSSVGCYSVKCAWGSIQSRP